MSEPFLAQVMIVPYNFAPRGWAFCSGQILPIAQNTALFSLLGTTYGGDGRVTFALPDLRGRAPLHPGQGPGLTERLLGERSGSETVTLLTPEMPVHTHGPSGNSSGGDQMSPTGNFWAAGGRRGENAFASAAGGSPPAMHPQATSIVGAGLPHENRPPYLALNFVIALEGIFPSRN